MFTNVYMQGLLMGFSYVAPIGIQNLFVINSALSRTAFFAWLTALIVIFFDVSLAVACYFGVGLVMAQSPLIEPCILVLGALMIAYMGAGLVRAKVDNYAQKAERVEHSLPRVVGMACAVAWLNPQALIDGSLMLGAFRASLPPESGIAFLGGVCTASVCWFLGLTGVTRLARQRITPKLLLRINQVCGIILCAYALKLLWIFYEKFVA